MFRACMAVLFAFTTMAVACPVARRDAGNETATSMDAGPALPPVTAADVEHAKIVKLFRDADAKLNKRMDDIERALEVLRSED